MKTMSPVDLANSLLANAYPAKATMPDYTAKVDAVLAHCNGFTIGDFADLAMAALDQAGLGSRDQGCLGLMEGE